MAAAAFEKGPNLRSAGIVADRVERLAKVNNRLAERGVDSNLLVVTALLAEDGITSYVKSLNHLGPKVGVTVDVANAVNARVAQRRVEEANDRAGATMLMVPLPNREDEPRLLQANKREIEGITFGSRFAPSTPQASVHVAEYGLGHKLTELPDPDRDVVVVGRGRSVGLPLIGLLGNMGIDPYVVTRADEPEQYRRIHGARVTISAVGIPGLLGAEQLGTNTSGSPERFAVDVGVKRVDGTLCGDIDRESVEGIPDLMFTPPYDASGPMNAITMLERATFLTAEKVGLLGEFDVTIHSMMGLLESQLAAA